jgi:hypothetical protein
MTVHIPPHIKELAEMETEIIQLRNEREAIKRYLQIPDSLDALCCIERCVYNGNLHAEDLLDH